MYPLKLKPAVKDFIWGGDNLKKNWNKKSFSDIIAESWEVSCHKDGPSIIDNGEYKGQSLSEYIKMYPNVIGKNAAAFECFPILIKLIDANTSLSIQVHPSDEYALKNENQYGKTEMWYVVDCKEGAGVYCGLNKKISKQQLKEDLEKGTILDDLNFIKVNKGDCIFIPSGTIHAICGGLLIYEVQQNSSLTYRLFDYNRVDKNGNKRELHINKSLDVINLDSISEKNSTVKVVDVYEKSLAECKYFKTRELLINGDREEKLTSDSFVTITVVSGQGEVILDGNKESLKLGDSVFIPAEDSKYILKGNMVVIETRV